MMFSFKLIFLSLCSFFVLSSWAQTIGSFNSIQPTTQTQNIVIPPTHAFQKIIRTGTRLPSGETVGSALDFTGYVPINGSSNSGYLSINSETGFANVTVLTISFNLSSKLWNVTDGHNVIFPQAETGYMGPLCAGTVMPNGHVMVCEESMAGPDSNGDSYFDDGWISEIDPVTHSVVNQDGVAGVDKLWAMGRQKHEDVVMTPDMSVAYWSADNDTAGYVYKFVPFVPGNFSAGQLYVLQTTGALGTGTWQQIPNTSAAERNNTTTSAKDNGAYNFVRIEGIERGPEGKIYFAATTSGRIYRFHDNGSGVDGLEVFVEPASFDVDGVGPYPPVAWGNGADNLAFDGEGNLWVLQDGGNNYIWVVGPDHTAANPNVRLFAIMPSGSEPTGITFSPDYKYLFMSVQHPNNTNTASQTDAAGNAVVFDESTAIVIARKENLGVVALPINLLSFDAKQIKSSVQLNWKTASVDNDEFSVERSTNNIQFISVGTVKANTTSFRFTDDKLPSTSLLYYRLKQKTKDGPSAYSDTKAVRLQEQNAVAIVYPSPAADKLFLRFTNPVNLPVTLTIINTAGVAVGYTVKSEGTKAVINVGSLPSGAYYLLLETAQGRSTLSFVKQ